MRHRVVQVLALGMLAVFLLGLQPPAAADPAMDEGQEPAAETADADPGGPPQNQPDEDEEAPGPDWDGSHGRVWDPSAEQVFQPGDIAARAETEGVSLDEAERRFRVENAAAVLQQEVDRRWPDSTAGVWMSLEPFGVVAAFTEETDQRVEELREDFPYPDELHGQAAELSLAELVATQRRMIEDRVSLRNGRTPPGLPASIRQTGGHYDLDIDLQNNHLVVGLAQPSAEVRRDFRQHYLDRLETRKGLARPSCAIWDCRYTMMGGLELRIYYWGALQAFCSTAFTAEGIATGNRFVISAGHCQRDWTGNGQTTYRHQQTTVYGQVTRWTTQGAVDAERIARTNSSWNEVPRFFVESESPRPVYDYVGWPGVVVGTWVGKTGMATGTTRGVVESKFESPWWIPNSFGFIRASMCTRGGDSGGAIWRHNSAYGILSGTSGSTTCGDFNGTLTCCSLGQKTIFGAMDNALADLNLKLLTATGPVTSAGCTVRVPNGPCLLY